MNNALGKACVAQKRKNKVWISSILLIWNLFLNGWWILGGLACWWPNQDCDAAEGTWPGRADIHQNEEGADTGRQTLVRLSQGEKIKKRKKKINWVTSNYKSIWGNPNLPADTLWVAKGKFIEQTALISTRCQLALTTSAWLSPCWMCSVLSHYTYQFDPKYIEGGLSLRSNHLGAEGSQTPNFSAPAPLCCLIPATPGWFLTSFIPVRICNIFMLATGFITNCPCVKRPKSGL